MEKKRKASIRGLSGRITHLETAIEKQLNDDFKVHEYLNDNPPDDKNIEHYIALYNKLLVKKANKQKRKTLLKSSKAQLLSHQAPEEEPMGNSIMLTSFHFNEQQFQKLKTQSEAQQELVESRTHEEMEVSKILAKEIMEKKKTLNLLKGDIGHMIARNESITMLESKINKVSLVSNSQLKRVSFALMKDWEEVEERQNMQRRFHQRLKQVDYLEKKNLKRIKNIFIEGMKRKKIAHDKLLNIEIESAAVDEETDIEQQYKDKNEKTIAIYNLMVNLCHLIDEFAHKEVHKKSELQDFSNLVKQSLLSILSEQNKEQPDVVSSIDMIDSQALSSLVSKILNEYSRVASAIQQKKLHYNLLIESEEELNHKLRVLKGSKDMMNVSYIEDERFQLMMTPWFPYNNYIHTFKLYTSNLKALFLLFAYFNHKIGDQFDLEKQHLTNGLFNNYLFLANVTPEVNSMAVDIWGSTIDEDVLLAIDGELDSWFGLLRQELSKKKKTIVVRPKFLSKKDSSVNESAGFLHEEDLSDEEDKQKDQFKIKNIDVMSNRLQHLRINEHQQPHRQQPQRQQPHKTEEQAKRVMLLEKIDHSYHKMIKQTLEMEKQNTRKNYHFKKNFKRTKYSSQDELLEEKRFESTFSGLFKPSREDTMRTSPSKKHSSQWGSQSFKSTQLISKTNKITPKGSKTVVSSLHNCQETKSIFFNHNNQPSNIRRSTKKPTIQIHRQVKTRPGTSGSQILERGRQRMGQKLQMILHQI